MLKNKIDLFSEYIFFLEKRDFGNLNIVILPKRKADDNKFKFWGLSLAFWSQFSLVIKRKNKWENPNYFAYNTNQDADAWWFYFENTR